MVTVALVPARAGSTRIRHKNMQEINGKPLCSWTFRAGIESQSVDEVYVSTDSPDVLSVAKAYGVSSLGLRKRNVGNHSAVSAVAVDFLLEFREAKGFMPDRIFLLLPTCPFRSGKDIDKFWETASNYSGSAISVSRAFGINPNWALIRNEDGRLGPVDMGKWGMRSQDFAPTFFPNGAVWVSDVTSLLSWKDFRRPDSNFIEVSPISGFDIDEPWELDFAREVAQVFLV